MVIPHRPCLSLTPHCSDAPLPPRVTAIALTSPHLNRGGGSKERNAWRGCTRALFCFFASGAQRFGRFPPRLAKPLFSLPCLQTCFSALLRLSAWLLEVRSPVLSVPLHLCCPRDAPSFLPSFCARREGRACDCVCVIERGMGVDSFSPLLSVNTPPLLCLPIRRGSQPSPLRIFFLGDRSPAHRPSSASHHSMVPL